MIRIKRSRVRTPAALAGSDSPGGKERKRAIEFFSDPANREGSLNFKAYKHSKVIEALNELFYFKCAYCESKYAATQPVDVEHYRPKAAVVVEGNLKKPAYYWLAAAWDNLLPSCIDCNRARTQDFPDIDPAVAGKASQFPIGNEPDRAEAPDEERNERRLLLDPCRDRPERHLEFTVDGVVRPTLKTGNRASRKGTESIKVFALQRVGLVGSRRDRLTLVLGQIKRVAWLIERLDLDPDDSDIERQLTDELAELSRLQADDQQYAAMARQFIARFLDTVR